MAEMKICVVGSGGVGKSCVTIRFLKNKFADYYDPTIEESYRKGVVVDDYEQEVELVDTAGQEEFASFRDSAFDCGDGFVLVCGINSQSSFQELQALRTKILRVKDAESFPMVVIGNKKDLEEEGQRTVPEDELRAYTDLHKIPYFETSAKTGLNIENCFHEIIRQVRKFHPPPPAPTPGAGKKNSKKAENPRGTTGGSTSGSGRSGKSPCVIL